MIILMHVKIKKLSYSIKKIIKLYIYSVTGTRIKLCKLCQVVSSFIIIIRNQLNITHSV